MGDSLLVTGPQGDLQAYPEDRRHGDVEHAIGFGEMPAQRCQRHSDGARQSVPEGKASHVVAEPDQVSAVVIDAGAGCVGGPVHTQHAKHRIRPARGENRAACGDQGILREYRGEREHSGHDNQERHAEEACEPLASMNANPVVYALKNVWA